MMLSQSSAASSAVFVLLCVGFFGLLFWYANRIGNKVRAVGGIDWRRLLADRYGLKPTTKTVSIPDDAWHPHSDRAIQREIAKQEALGYELVTMTDNRGAFAGKSAATLVFRRK